MSKWVSLCCSICKKQISSPVPASTQIRAWIECSTCHKANKHVEALKQLVLAIHDAAREADWLSMSLADALISAENLILKKTNCCQDN